MSAFMSPAKSRSGRRAAESEWYGQPDYRKQQP
jgi:hypothetical protein